MVVCQACLEHRHSYVRKNAALAVLNIHHNFGQDLLPDGPELIDKFIKVRGSSLRYSSSSSVALNPS